MHICLSGKAALAELRKISLSRMRQRPLTVRQTLQIKHSAKSLIF